jgi:exonuclease III
MKLLSFNCRGLAGPHKKYALHRLVESSHPDILLLQETMGEEATIIPWLRALFKNWDFVGLDAMSIRRCGNWLEYKQNKG